MIVLLDVELKFRMIGGEIRVGIGFGVMAKNRCAKTTGASMSCEQLQ